MRSFIEMSEMSAIPELRDMEQLTFPAATITAVVRMKAPRRILHFSDGTMEEYSTDDEIDAENEKNMQLDVKRNTHEWGPWMIQHILNGGNRMLAACDFVGEKIAAALGITTPKYSYEIEQFKKLQQEKAKAKEEERSVGGWMQDANDVHSVTSENGAIENIIKQQPNVEKY